MDYETQFAKLNPQQQEAVKATEGAVMVIAGPGTGKTQLLSMRVAHILQATDTSAQEILCLTFTDKAATNMRERLGGFIGTEAHNVMIKTFHGFGAEVMNMYPDHFWNAARLNAAPDALQLEIIDSLLRKLPHHNPLALRFAGNPTLTRDVRDALKQAKEAGLTPSKLKALVDLNLTYIDEIEADLCSALENRISKKTIPLIAEAVAALPDSSSQLNIAPFQPLSEIIKDSFEQTMQEVAIQNKTAPLSKWKKQWFQTVGGKPGLHDERKRNQWWLALADVYKDYRSELHSRGYFDYADMIIEVITQLEQDQDLRSMVQERFNYVLIDEFQDTNEAQMRLAHLVADHPVANGNPNIMVVGDDDQAIYKFQGAELNNLLNFRRSYPQAKVIVLENNYRSHQTVLDTAKQIIEQAEHRLVTHESDISKNIRSACDQPSGQILHYSYATQADQYVHLADQIKQAFNNDKSVAVLARNNESLRQMASILHDKNIPVHYEQQNNVFEHPMTVQLIHICRIVQALLEGDSGTVNVHLALTLRHPMWQIEPRTLWELAVNSRRSDWLSGLRETEGCEWIVEWLEDLATCATTEHLNVVISEMLGLTGDSTRPVSPIFRHYADQKPVSSEYLSGLSALRLMRNLVADFGRNQRPTLADFLRFIEVHQENNLVLADESPFITAPKAVTLMTVYKAKGLEFDSVFIIDAVDSVWSPRRGGRKPPANLPLRPAGDDWDDYVRLMYVAVTRAVSDVIIGSFRYDASGKEVLASPIISHVLPASIVEPSKDQAAITVLESNLTWPRLDSTDEHQLLADKLSRYQLNATAVIHFLDITRSGPRAFFENHILQLPSAKTPYQSHGTAVHAALEHGQKLANNGRFDIEEVIKTYKTHLSQEMLIIDEFDRWSDEGERGLRRLFADLGFALKPGNLPERRFRDIACGECIISGAFDCIQDDGKNLIITDYKTGKPVSSLTTKTKTEGVKAWSHRLQLTFYSLIASHSADYHGRQITGRMVYVEAEEPRLLEKLYQPSPEEVDRLQMLINIIWKRILDLSWPDISEYEPSLNGILQFEQDLLDGKK